MISFRKLKRKKHDIHKPHKPDKKYRIVNVFLIIGLTLTLIGIIVGLLNYAYFVAGRPEEIANTRVGTFYIPEDAPGDPGRKYGAIFGFVITGIGIILSAFCLIINKLSQGKILREERGTKETNKGNWPNEPPFNFPWE